MHDFKFTVLTNKCKNTRGSVVMQEEKENVLLIIASIGIPMELPDRDCVTRRKRTKQRPCKHANIRPQSYL